MFLVDTNVLSELRLVSMQRGSRRLAAWSDTVLEEDLHLSVMTLQEIEIGVLRSERKDKAKGRTLRRWMDGIMTHYRDRIIPVTTPVAMRSAQLHAQRTFPISDALIAATAYVHGFDVVTRNVRDFQDAGVRIINPWDTQLS